MGEFDPGDTVELTNNGADDTHDLPVYVAVGTVGTVIVRYSSGNLEGPDARYIVEFNDHHPSGKPIRQHVAGDQLART